MKAKLFDFEHEKDLEEAINDFINNTQNKIISIQYQSSHFSCNGEQIFSFSALIIYE